MTVQLWNQVLDVLSLSIRWHGQSVSEAWDLWRAASSDSKIHCLPLLVCWSIWLTRNGIIFRGKLARWPFITAKIITAYHELPDEDHTPTNQVVTPETIDITIPWTYFDGATQAHGCGGGILFHLSEHHHFKIQMGLGVGTNKFAEMISLRHILHFSLVHSCNHL